MKNYLRFVIAVFGVTIAIFSSTDAVAKMKQTGAGTCSDSCDTCGTTPDGDAITGKFIKG